MLSIFYITVFIFRSRLHLLKALSALSLLALYVCAGIYYTSMCLDILPIVQKVSLVLKLGWVLALEYRVSPADLSPASKEV